MRVDMAHAASSRPLIIFGLATSVPLIVAGSALLMALLERFPILVWAGAALLGWVAGEIMVKDPATRTRTLAEPDDTLHVWAAAAGAIFVVALRLPGSAPCQHKVAGAAADRRSARSSEDFHAETDGARSE